MNATTINHFLDLHMLDKSTVRNILNRSQEEKRQLQQQSTVTTVPGKQLAMIFEKPSTRTRVSFEAGINQLGGKAILLDTQSSQLGRGETIADTAKVLSRYIDLIMIRCYNHDTLLELAENATVPVINGLTDFSHPCQILADIQTFEEHSDVITGKKVAWIGDGNNMTHSWIHAASMLDFTLFIATPDALQPNQEVIDWATNQNANIVLTNDPREAAENADLITTDTWVSMGDSNAEERKKLLTPYQVNQELMNIAKKDALFMHCLPAHREEEVTSEVIDGKQSVVWDEAENRLHIQKAIMLWCLGN